MSLCQKCPWRLWAAFEVGIASSRHWGTGDVGIASPQICIRTAFPGKSSLDEKKCFFWNFLGTKNYQSFEVLFLTHANNLVSRRPQWQHSHFFFSDCWCPWNVISVSSWNKKPEWKVITSIHILTLPREGCAHGSSMLSQKTKCFQGMKENCWGLHCVLILPTGHLFPRGLQEGIQKMYTRRLFSLPTPDFNFIIFKPYAFH